MKSFKEKTFRSLTYLAALLTIACMLGIIAGIFGEGMPLFRSVGIREFLFTNSWYPTHTPREFGALALIVGSLVVTLGALIIAIPLGLGSAIFISEIAGNRLREIAKPVIELLAGIPSVVYGLFGMAFLAPLLREWLGLETGLNVFTASVILGVMIVPIICSMSEDALSGIPRNIREASFALGATRIETIFKAVIPAAKSGIIGSVLMGFGRAIGETMVVLMVAGGAASIPESIFAPARPMTSTIAAEMGETVMGDLHYRSLFALAILLFLITFVSNLVTELVFLKKRDA
ncbi:MAG TPA: phosphate ABC transporter permease subunit PstC [Candidatus Cloacimonadota bacterium]|nr:phosphate ABC transporter permease subunit PstC [Candidatus Cloacimonadota bacterium]HPS39615.1 phosphate ABC transporter permease subunit PstC [Candidatus Cloacimonadota bacterium]